MTTLAKLLQPEDILLDLAVTNRSELFETVGCHMERLHALAPGWVAIALAHRERVGSTALGQGVAIPHARMKDLDHIQLAYVRPRHPLWFDAPDDRPVADFLIILVPKEASAEHLQILAEASQMFSSLDFRQRLHGCTRPEQVKLVFDGWAQIAETLSP